MSFGPAFSSAMPRLIVLRANPVATAVALTPPWPSAIASFAAKQPPPTFV